ncbi:MAG: YaiI/YqxD family protein, partial [Myxococcota bacterium]
WMRLPQGPLIKRVVVQEGPDAADDWIVEHAVAGDIVVTADIPLAARCLELGARVLSTNGRVFNDDSIGDLLATRDLKAQLRGAGVMSGGPPPMSEKDRSRFLSKLDELVQRGLREQRSA